MKRAIFSLVLAAFAAPAGAQSASDTVNAELRAFAARYVEQFNKGDRAAIAILYDLPGVSTSDRAVGE